MRGEFKPYVLSTYKSLTVALKTETCYRFSLKIPNHNTNLICMWIMCVSGDVGTGGGGGGGGEGVRGGGMRGI